MKDYPFRFNRPTPKFDGEEIYFVFTPDDSMIIYGEIEVHQGLPTMLVKTDSDIRVGDIVEIPSIEGA